MINNIDFITSLFPFGIVILVVIIILIIRKKGLGKKTNSFFI